MFTLALDVLSTSVTGLYQVAFTEMIEQVTERTLIRSETTPTAYCSMLVIMRNYSRRTRISTFSVSLYARIAYTHQFIISSYEIMFPHRVTFQMSLVVRGKRLSGIAASALFGIAAKDDTGPGDKIACRDFYWNNARIQ